MLAAARRLRGGAIDLVDVDAESRATLGDNLAGVCRTIARWADTSLADRRAADAFVRFHGLGQMPEQRAGIAATLRTLDGSRGLSVDTLDELIDSAEQQLATEIDELVFPPRWGIPTPGRWCDPFSTGPASDARRLQAAVLLAWADVPVGQAAAHQAARALLLYEHEHALRDPIVALAHRQERARLRRLAWSMVWTARQRLVAREPGDVVIDRLLGPRHLATVDRLPDGVAELLVDVRSFNSHDVVELIDDAIGVGRDAVRSGASTASELVGLLRDAVARMHPSAVGPDKVAAVLSLHTIIARESGHISGVQSGNDAVVLGLEAGSLVRNRARSLTSAESSSTSLVASFALRAAQELAELTDLLGMQAEARRALRRMLRLIDDKEEQDRLVWRQQYCQTAASVLRHTALASSRPSRWLDAAGRAADMSWRLAIETDLPPGTVVAAANQRTAVEIARFQLVDRPADGTNHRRLGTARQRVDEAIRLAENIDSDDRPHRSAIVGAYRRRWELAQLSGEYDEAIDARRAALARVGDWMPPTQLVKLDRLERASGQRRERRLAVREQHLGGEWPG